MFRDFGTCRTNDDQSDPFDDGSAIIVADVTRSIVCMNHGIRIDQLNPNLDNYFI